MTIERTREIFGSKVDHMTDVEVLRFIQETSLMCDSLLDAALTALKKHEYDG